MTTVDPHASSDHSVSPGWRALASCLLLALLLGQVAISVEAKGGVPEANDPRLSWLCKGALAHKAV